MYLFNSSLNIFPNLRAFCDKFSSETTSNAAIATTAATGFPPKVEPCCPGLITFIISLFAKTAETGYAPPEIAFPNIKISGIILNKVGSDKHKRILTNALKPLGIPILGSIYRHQELSLPSRHLGLVQAQELENLDEFLNNAAEIVTNSIDIKRILKLMKPIQRAKQETNLFLRPPSQSISIANDAAFSFTYPHILKEWRRIGVEISFFSPLKNEAPKKSDLVFLPGGYPELHAEKLANADIFKSSMKKANAVYGECGGYMTMGNGIIDSKGKRHEMLNLLNLETSFENKKLHLGYRNLSPQSIWSSNLKAHEFHYASTLKAEGKSLFKAK